MLDKEHLRKNLDALIWNIEEARIAVSEHHIVKLVTVGKYTELKNIETLYTLGQRAFGENQVQQLQTRSQELRDLPIEWHFIGTLQKNKINKLIETKPALMQSLDSVELALALDSRLAAKESSMPCLLQINSAKEQTKSGVSAEQAKDIYQEIQSRCPNIQLKGVMSIGAHTKDRAMVQESFEATYGVFDTLRSDGATICSMGMSGDYKLAIACGSNLIRVGSALFQ